MSVCCVEETNNRTDTESMGAWECERVLRGRRMGKEGGGVWGQYCIGDESWDVKYGLVYEAVSPK